MSVSLSEEVPCRWTSCVRFGKPRIGPIALSYDPGPDAITWEHDGRNNSLRAKGVPTIACPAADVDWYHLKADLRSSTGWTGLTGCWRGCLYRPGRDHRPMARGRLRGQFARARLQRAYHAEQAPARSR
jgi:hypothetical protein